MLTQRVIIALLLLLIAPQNAWATKCVRAALDEFVATMGNDPKKVAFSYAAPQPFTLEPVAADFWSEHLGADFKTTPRFAIHHSKKELLADGILAWTKPGETIAIYGDETSLKNGELLGRKIVSHGQKPRFVFIDEAAVLKHGGDARKIIASLQGKDSPTILVVRDASRPTGPTLLRASPRVIESVFFSNQSSGLSSSYALTTGATREIANLNAMLEARGQWMGKLHQMELRNYLSANNSKPTQPYIRQSVTLEPPSRPGENSIPKPGRISDFLRVFAGFNSRDYDTTYSMALGQPWVELSTPEVKRIIEQTAQLTHEQGRVRAQTAVRNWYLTKYGHEIPEGQIEFSNGASGAIFEILGALPRGSTILVPDLAFPAYAAQAKIFGLKVQRLPMTSADILKIEPATDVSMVVVNFPHNPTGEMLSPAAKQKLLQIANRGKIVLNDLGYTTFHYGDQPVQSLLTGVRDSKNILEIFSSSKDVGMPEARVAAIVGDSDVIQKIRQGPLRQEPEISGMRLGIVGELLQTPSAYVTDNAEMKLRRDLVIQAFRQTGWPSQSISVPQAGLNVTLEMPPWLSPLDFAKGLWERAGISVLPSDFFDVEGASSKKFVRISLSEDSTKLSKLSSTLQKSGVTYDKLPLFVTHADRPVATIPVGGGLEIKTYRSAFRGIEDLPLPVQQSWQIAQERYGDFYGPDSVRFLSQQQASVDPWRTTYFTAQSANPASPHQVRGGWMLLDGKSPSGASAPLPVEESFPHLSFRKSQHVYEGSRLAFDANSPGGAKVFARGLAEHFVKEFGSAEQIPDDIVVYIWTIRDKLSERYEQAGFRPSFSNREIGKPGKFILEMRKEDLLKQLNIP